ncbi:MAG: SgcJ/EcaC family oxidoreductase [Actinomycetota bacterium]|nr:SgcJ/EcaC family oxidoreductase [Actinomycetota bacterium]
MLRRVRSVLLAATAIAATAIVGGTMITPATAQESSRPRVSDCSTSRDAILDLPHQMFAAWEKGDGPAFASVFVDDGHMITSSGTYLPSRTAVSNYFTAAFAGPLKGTRQVGNPSSLRCLAPNVAVIDGLGGTVLPGETYTTPEEVPIGRRIIVSWVAVQVPHPSIARVTVWKMTEFQSTTIAA